MPWFGHIIGIIVMLIAFHYLRKWKVDFDCDDDMALKECVSYRSKKTYIKIVKTVCVLLVWTAIAIHILGLLGISLLPIISSILVISVTLGIILQTYVSDFANGIFYVGTGILTYDAVVKLSVPDCASCKINEVAIKIDELTPIHVHGVTKDGEKVTIRYHHIAAVEVLA